MPSSEFLMEPHNRLDESKIIAALLHDVHNAHGLVFNTQSLRRTLNKVQKRLSEEGIGFLTKTLPRLGKGFDKALAGVQPLIATNLGFKPQIDSELPRFLGEFINRVLRPDGTLLPQPCVLSVQVVRQVCYLFYKYKLAYSDEQELRVISAFKKTEEDISALRTYFQELEVSLKLSNLRRREPSERFTPIGVLREARRLLEKVFRRFDPMDIYPRHGPGVVATKQQLWGKYFWSNVCSRITDVYPFDAYFMASPGHVCDEWRSIDSVKSADLPARVILVPKDSRGPRLISCEPVDFQWIQQGLGRAIVEHVECHYLTRDNVHFTDQTPNQIGALWGSETGRYATLDLNEASDRVSADLVRLLFPQSVYTHLMACRSSSTQLPDASILPLSKFAPMGSCLCFPILALTIWAILTAAAPDRYTRERILVYGDDVIVPTAFAVNAMEQLESFGLKINRDKSCIGGLFRESCGKDAFKGIDVTPVRLRTVWSSLRSPDVYTSWIAYANSFYDRRYFKTSELITRELLRIYGPIPTTDMCLTCPSLREVPLEAKPLKRRWNPNLQRLEYHCLDVRSPSINKGMSGWSMLLRYFAEKVGRPRSYPDGILPEFDPLSDSDDGSFSVRQYTSRRASMLARRWR